MFKKFKSSIDENCIIVLVGDIQNVTDKHIKSLKEKNFQFFHNDASGKHFVFDFKIDGLWFESVEISNELDKIKLNVFK